jgi:hypothetical protein
LNMADDPENGESSAVNSQIVDSVSALAALTAGQGSASSASMLSLVAAETVALGLYNAIARQQADATISSASVAALCARMLGGGASVPVDAAASPLGTVAAAEAQAQVAIHVLQASAGQPGEDSTAANAALLRLAAAASAPHPVPGHR